MKKWSKLGSFILILVLVFSVVGCSSPTSTSTDSNNSEVSKIVIGGKNFTEQDVLVNMMKEIIEAKTKLTVETKAWLGGTLVVAKALDNGDLDIYAEYTGTALATGLKLPPMKEPQAVYDTVKAGYKEQKNQIWLEPFGFNNTWVVCMRKDDAEKLGIKTVSDLTKHAPTLTIGAEQESLERDDGLKGLIDLYGLKFKSQKGMDQGLMYPAITSKAVDIISATATDGRIAKNNLIIIKDDKQFFMPYFAAPVVREETLKKYPEIEDALKLLAGKLSDETMQQLNGSVDIDGKNAKDVAHDWLVSQGLIEK